MCPLSSASPALALQMPHSSFRRWRCCSSPHVGIEVLHWPNHLSRSLPLLRTELGEWSLKVIWTKALCNSQLYSEHQTMYALKVKENHISKVYNHKDKLHVAKACFSMEANKWILIDSCNEQSDENSLLSVPGRGTKAHSTNNFCVLEETEVTRLFCTFIRNSQDFLPHTTPFLGFDALSLF